jgi:ribosomal protein S10
MKTFNVTITSKNKNSVSDFFLFLLKNKTYNFNNLKKYFQKNKRKKRLTILKSPHVNKKAQEQFESRVFRKQFTIQTIKNFRYLTLLKRLSYNLFPDIDIKLKYVISSSDSIKLGLKAINPDYYKINKYYNLKANNLDLKNLDQLKQRNTLPKLLLAKKTSRLLKIFDLYGEFLKHMFE